MLDRYYYRPTLASEAAAALRSHRLKSVLVRDVIVPPGYKAEPVRILETAFHEAGHAVASVRLGFGLDHVLVREDGSGEAQPTRSTTDDGDNPAADLILIDLAGAVAEAEFRGISVEWIACNGAFEDYRRAIGRIESLNRGPRRDRKRINWHTRRAHRFVLVHWREIDRLAEEIMFHRNLDGKQVLAIIGANDV